MVKRFFYIFIYLVTLTPSWGINIVTPESFGAKGNGVSDDTKALQRAFEQGTRLQLDGTYLITKSLTLTDDISGTGKILIGKDDVSINCSSDGISIKGLTFDYQQHEGKLMRLKGASNVTLEDCVFLNVGNLTTNQSEGMVVISGGSHHIRINNCRFEHCYASGESSSAGVWVNFSGPEDRCHHIYVDNCYFDDFQPSADADAVKILGQNEDVFAYITNCEFRRCDKRALKFQGRECHSKNNVIYCTRPMYCAIDFQRGHGTSVNDRIIIDYDGKSEINPNAGLLYRAVCISQGNVSVKKLDVIAKNHIDNSHQIAVCLQSFGNFDDGTIDNVVFDRCNFNGQHSFMTASNSVEAISNVKLKRTTYKTKKVKNTILKINDQCKTTLKEFLKM